MKISGYELNFSEQELDDILANKMRNIELIGADFSGYQQLPDGDKETLKHLLNAAIIINDVALEQDNPLNRKLKDGLIRTAMESSYAKKALELFNSLNGVAGFNGIDKEPIQIFKDVELLQGKNFYPKDLSVKEFHDILQQMLTNGKIDEVKNILSARTMVRRNEDELIGIDYTVYFAKEFFKIATELEKASQTCSNDIFKSYLMWQVQALLHTDEKLDMMADKFWAEMQDTNLEFTISRENYEDEMTGTIFDNLKLLSALQQHNIEVVSKDTLGCRVGIVNKTGTEFILESQKTLPYLATWMPFNDKYEQSINKNDVKQTMVDADLMTLTGDYAMCRGGITTAQNLPNNDKLSIKTGGGRRNVYHRQVRMSSDKRREKELLNALVEPKLHQYFDTNAIHTWVIGHENGHSLGPLSEYQNAMGIYKHIIEEHKADIISVASMQVLCEKFNLFEKDYLKTIYTSWCISLFLKAKPVFSAPHRMAELIQFNYMLENKGMYFDENKKLNINFDKISSVMYDLLKETINLQLSKSVEKAKSFVDRWAYWSENSAYIADVQQKLGNKPYIKIVTKF
ncbi:MAG: hypothetical protein IJ019_04125 [Alphaproteobacteria bacterium]|nr:hypothetical protein [Alphaproteobacteria bacterium]